MKRISALTLTLIIIACFSTAPANAGASRRHTIEGFVLGTGVALIGTAIIHGMNNERPCSPNYPKHKKYGNNRHKRQYAKYNDGPRGYWTIQKVWVAHKHKKRWNPGHTTPRGHWQAQRVWIETKYKHR